MKTNNSFREIGLLAIGLVIVGVVTVIIIGTFRGRNLSEAPITTTPYSTATFEEPTTTLPYPVPLENPLTPTAAARQTAQGPLDTQYAIMLATYMVTTPSPTLPRTFAPTGTREGERIQPSGEKMGLDAQNAWVGILDGYPVSVFAGALSGVPEQGAIYIFVELPNTGVNEQILTPTQHGGVRVVSEQNNRLTLVSTDGTTYYFDVPARRFVDSLTEIVPIATLPATKTLLPPPPTLGGSTPVPPTYNPYPAPTGQNTAAP
jgi:cytoskeletal protein RodZ